MMAFKDVDEQDLNFFASVMPWPRVVGRSHIQRL